MTGRRGVQDLHLQSDGRYLGWFVPPISPPGRIYIQHDPWFEPCSLLILPWHTSLGRWIFAQFGDALLRDGGDISRGVNGAIGLVTTSPVRPLALGGPAMTSVLRCRFGGGSVSRLYLI